MCNKITIPYGKSHLACTIPHNGLLTSRVDQLKSEKSGLELVQEAVALFNRGLYDEAKAPFEEVISRDSNYWFAYIGLGNAYYTDGDYETAMDYFYMHSRGGYNRAFKEYRINFVRSNFNVFIIAIVAVIVLLVVATQIRKYFKKKKSKAGGKK